MKCVAPAFEHHRGLLLLLPVLLLMACRTDPAVPPAQPPPPPDPLMGTLQVTLVPEWNGQPFEVYTELQNFMDYRVVVERLMMYFGDIRLIDGTDTTFVKNVDLFRLDNGAYTCQWSVAPGTYGKLRAGLGVPAALNYADPASYGVGHPLNVNNGTYWTWATGYRYVVFEGKYDTDPLGTLPPSFPFAIHPGMEPSYLEFELEPATGIAIAVNDTSNIVVDVAVDRFFVSDTDTIDLATENNAHGNNQPLQWKLVNNIVKSFSIQ